MADENANHPEDVNASGHGDSIADGLTPSEEGPATAEPLPVTVEPGASLDELLSVKAELARLRVAVNTEHMILANLRAVVREGIGIAAESGKQAAVDAVELAALLSAFLDGAAAFRLDEGGSAERSRQAVANGTGFISLVRVAWNLTDPGLANTAPAAQNGVAS